MGFTTGTGAERRLHLVDVSGAAPRELASFAGAGLALSPVRNEAAYFAVEETDALKAARARLDSLQRAGVGGGGGGGFGGPAGQLNAEIARQEAAASRVRVRDLGTGQERDVPTPGLAGLSALRYGRDGNLYVSSSVAGGDPNTTNIYALAGGTPKAVSDGAGTKNFIGASATHVVYATAGTTANWLNIYVRTMATGATTNFAGRNPAMSGDGSLLAFVGAIGTDTTLNVITLATGAAAIVKQGPAALATPRFRPMASWWRFRACPARTGRSTWSGSMAPTRTASPVTRRMT